MGTFADNLPLPPPGVERVRHLMAALADAAGAAGISLDHDAHGETRDVLNTIEVDTRGYAVALDEAVVDDASREAPERTDEDDWGDLVDWLQDKRELDRDRREAA